MEIWLREAFWCAHKELVTRKWRTLHCFLPTYRSDEVLNLPVVGDPWQETYDRIRKLCEESGLQLPNSQRTTQLPQQPNNQQTHTNHSVADYIRDGGHQTKEPPDNQNNADVHRIRTIA